MAKKKVCVIAALSQNGVYGQDGKLPWKIPEEERIFKERTTGHGVIMGKRTLLSLHSAVRPLPDRENIVLTTGQDFHAPGVRICSSLGNAIRVAESDVLFIIGGLPLWAEAMGFADEAWITVVRADYPVDALTLTAPALLHPARYWSGIVPHEIDRHPSFGNVPAFDIHHWVRI